MTLKAFLQSLKTSGVLVNVTDTDDNLIIKFYASGVESLDDELEAREILKWSIANPTTINVVVKDAEVTPDPEPTPEPDNGSGD